MKAIVPIVLIAVAVSLCGCSDEPIVKFDEIYSWEFQSEFPPTSPQDYIINLEKSLRDAGYMQVVTKGRYSDSWTPRLVGIRVFATRRPPVKTPTPPTTLPAPPHLR